MALPLNPPVPPQLARTAKTLPIGSEWVYEQKLDGFRAIAFVDGDEVYLQSRGLKPLRRYFPELVFPAVRYVLDGEIVIVQGGREDFEAMQMRLHPAASRVARLAAEMPATFVAFDLLAEGDEVLTGHPWHERRARLEAIGGLTLGRVVESPDEAQSWLESAEGVIAKERDAPYRPGERTGMVKIKRVRTVDAVVMGWRPGKEAGTVGSFILGCYEPDGTLRPIGHTSGFTAKQKRDLVDVLAPYATGEHGSGAPSRWSADRDLEWVALRPEMVVEITFDHVSGGRIRHGAKLVRFRNDRDPGSCGTHQLEG